MDTQEKYVMVNGSVCLAQVITWDNSTLLVSSREIEHPTLSQLNEALDNPF
jgi:hypothetical protein